MAIRLHPGGSSTSAVVGATIVAGVALASEGDIPRWLLGPLRIRTFLADVPEGESLHVTQAANSEEAALLLDAQEFHLMITELRMPRPDGLA